MCAISSSTWRRVMTRSLCILSSLKVTLVWKKLAAEAKQKLATEAKLKLAAEAKLRKEAKDRESDDSTLLYYKQWLVEGAFVQRNCSHVWYNVQCLYCQQKVSCSFLCTVYDKIAAQRDMLSTSPWRWCESFGSRGQVRAKYQRTIDRIIRRNPWTPLWTMRQ